MIGMGKFKAAIHEKVVAPQQATAALAVAALIIGIVALSIAIKGGK